MQNDKSFACALTMVRDDYFFLERWIRYYGNLFGKDALYIVNHGANPKVAEIAEGCSVINIPDMFSEMFDAMRWRMLTNFANGLRSYYEFIIVGDVDEYVVPDPKLGLDLPGFLAKRRRNVTLTPIGLEVVHLSDRETQPIADSPMLGVRRYVRYTSAYSKPCVLTKATHLSRGGHYANDPELKLFKNLYLFHMRFVDKDLYLDTLARRTERVDSIEKDPGDDKRLISREWRREFQKDDPMAGLQSMPIREEFDLSREIRKMEKTWGPRGEEGLHAFEKNIGDELMALPERFFGIV
ncbi:MAG TPA: hypothetical protein DEO85_09825 [Maritimibacter sp.]|nr:hypothetical protein [Maritimibacter sp.]